MTESHPGMWWESDSVATIDAAPPGDGDGPEPSRVRSDDGAPRPRVSRATRRATAIVAVVAGAATVLALLSVQVRPSINEVALVDVVYLAVLAVLVVAVPNRTIMRSLWWTIPAFGLVAALGTWNPWRLAAVDLAFGHPYVAVMVASLLLALGCLHWVGRTPAPRGRWLAFPLCFAFGLAGIGAFLAAGLSLARAPGPAVAAASEPGPGLRVDTHEDLGLCGHPVAVLRVGEGLGLRERVLTPCRDWRMVDGRLEMRVCNDQEPYLDHSMAFDPQTLELLEDRTSAFVEPPLEPNSARRACGTGGG